MINALQTSIFNFQKFIINCHFLLKVLKIDHVGECVFVPYKKQTMIPKYFFKI